MPASSPYFSPQVERAERFHFTPPGSIACEVAAGGREECPASYDLERANFPLSVMEFIARGTGRIRLGRESWQLPPGHLYVYNKELPHRLSSLTSRGMTKYFVVLRGAKVRRTLAAHGLTPGRVVQVSDPARIAEIFDDLVRTGCSQQRNRRAACTTILKYLLIKIDDLALSRERLVSGAYSAYLKCLRTMEQHCVGFSTVEQLARACQVDRAYLCRLFQRFGEETPYQHLARLRMNYAARELRQTDRSVRELAEELGFSDAAAFSRAFKRTIGLPPSEVHRVNAASS